VRLAITLAAPYVFTPPELPGLAYLKPHPTTVPSLLSAKQLWAPADTSTTELDAAAGTGIDVEVLPGGESETSELGHTITLPFLRAII
jgi:hypothetical protein